MLGMVLGLIVVLDARAGELSVRVQDAAGKPVENAVVSLFGAARATATAEAVMDQMGLEFSPHVLAVQAGTKVSFPNKDQVHHQLYSFSKPKSFELPLYKGADAAPLAFEQPGVVKLGCNIHDWMAGYIIVVEHPYFALTGSDGVARLTAPEGARELLVWSERLKGSGEFRQAVNVGAQPQSLTLTIKAGPPPQPRSRSGSQPKY